MQRQAWFRRRARPAAQGVSSINIEDAFRRSPSMVALNLLVAVLFSASAWAEANAATVTSFMLASVLSTVLRTALILGYRLFRRRLSELHWMYAFILSMWVAAAVQKTFRNASHGTIAITMLPACLSSLVSTSGPAFMLAVGMMLALMQTFRSANLVQGAFE